MEYLVRRVNIGRSQQLDKLALACGSLYSLTVVWFWRFVRKHGEWIKPSSMMRWLNSKELHAHTADACVQAFYASLKSWRSRRKADPTAKPPKRRRRFFRIEYKNSAIHHKEGKLVLSNGRGNPPLILDWPWQTPRTVIVRWQGEQYEAIATYIAKKQAEPIGNKVAGIDLGEVHIATAHDGENCTILNGRLLRTKRRYQNKLKAKLSHLIDTKKKGSRRHRRLVRSKKKQLVKVKNQIRDILHKQTTYLISTLHASGVQTVAIGDMRDIRDSLDYGAKVNQKLHQMVHGTTRQMLTYKAQRMGMVVKLQGEEYTSQSCPVCPRMNKPKGRKYECECGFSYHRDGVGSYNIRKKYLGFVSVVGEMASPTGMRYKPHARVARISSVPASRD